MAPSHKPATTTLLLAPRYELLPLDGASARAGALPDGATVTVTCSPTKGQDVTVALAVELAGRGFRVVPHLAARRVGSLGHLEDIVGRLVAAGIDDVFCIGGDGGEPDGPYDTALGLLEGMAALGSPFGDVGIAGHPEAHHCADHETLDAALVAKQPFATYLTTQLCFDVDQIAAWARRIRAGGITLPIYAGIPGVVDRGKLLRVSMRIGMGDSVRFLRHNRGAALRLLRAGSYRPDGLVKQLAAWQGPERIAGLHIFTFNETGATAAWVQRAQARAGPRRPSRARRSAPADAEGTADGPARPRPPIGRRSSRLRLALTGRGG